MKTLCTLLGIALSVSAFAQTSENNRRLRNALREYPEADANKEGVRDPRDPEGKGDLKQYVKPNLPPCIHFFGTGDPFLPGAREFTEAYKNEGNRCELVTYEGEGHSFFNKDNYYELTIAETDKFLTGLGWLEKESETK